MNKERFLKLCATGAKTLWPLLPPSAITGVAAVTETYLEAFAGSVHPHTIVWSTVVLAAALAGAVSMLIQRPRPAYDSETDTYIAKDGKMRYCVNCLHQRKERIPLKNEAHGWRCPLVGCKQYYSDRSRPYMPLPSQEADPNS